ncbi:MAG: undecaprenyl/decaprenyl-phosphate alpha-N-acetylglucosaminyl 1-phosphate transferase [Flavobacteriaceae bacterium]|jgi:UDP-N-acetylmuramyl pentapeptide phosphotransferase/UDP-N-acetylglucosamine-1-phosphate transferase|nr:undecaprenyl/decaprenyl-phosphate alpha-N-acetylglucosaminyl 1-phosphate transferase [Flavobacteriaceae bacterium]
MKNLSLEAVANILGYSSLYLKVILSFSLSFLLTFIAIPKIIRVSYRKQLMDIPGVRSSHVKKVPRLGGVAIYFAITVVSSIFAHEMLYQIVFFSAALVLLFFIGLMDDLLVVAPRKKLIAQLISAVMIVVGSDVRIHSFFGLFGIYELPYLLSVLFTIFIIVLIINSYNLIDGIDGLASGVGVLISLCFVFIFFRLYDYSMGFLAIAILGALLAFLYFNMSSHYKIFMGDTGSMVVGYLIAFMAIKFIDLASMPYVMIDSAPVIAIAILIVPLIDTLSVIIIRLWKGKSPFAADQNHIHHRVLRLGFSHVQTAVIICVSNALIIGFAYTIRQLNISLMLGLITFAALVLSYLPLVLGEFLIDQKIKKREEAG